MQPEQIRVDVQSSMLYLTWQDGQQQSLSHQKLRQHCPCGFCRAKRIRQQPIDVVASIQITAMYDQGYGVQICFTDGHQQGIFPWPYLYELGHEKIV